MKRKLLSKSEMREFNEHIRQFTTVFDKKDAITQVSDGESTQYYLNTELIFFTKNSELIPTLKLHLKHKLSLPECVVDMGAIKFVIGGADIMRPGIVALPENIPTGSFVLIVEVDQKRPLAIGKLVYPSSDINEMKTGKVISNLHYLGDKYWETRL
jgi:PUA-domain protein